MTTTNTTIDPVQLFKCLADETRLTTILMLQAQTELCVCELTWALDVSQPKISRHLSQLRLCGLLQDRRQGQWVYYRLHPQLPEWALQVIAAAHEGNQPLVAVPLARLNGMEGRPIRCCEG
ncbi:MAG: metalloregulator ArsR/SmtB family transcription factor [Marinobacterium sp.]|nr:metalloregulator ArsR/SmtB family transcription factor [Marinobacterium sp.]